MLVKTGYTAYIPTINGSFFFNKNSTKLSYLHYNDTKVRFAQNINAASSVTLPAVLRVIIINVHIHPKHYSKFPDRAPYPLLPKEDKQGSKHPNHASPAYRSTTIFIAATKISMAIKMITRRLQLALPCSIAKKKMIRKRGEGRGRFAVRFQHTYPFEHFAVAVSQLVFENSQQVGNYIQPLCHQTNSLIHFKIAPDCLVDWL